MRRQCRTSGQNTAKSISIKGAKRISGDCARKVEELTPGDLPCVRNGLRLSQGSLTAGQKPAEGVVCAEQRVLLRRVEVPLALE